MATKEIVSDGEKYQITKLDRATRGVETEVLSVDGNTGLVKVKDLTVTGTLTPAITGAPAAFAVVTDLTVGGTLGVTGVSTLASAVVTGAATVGTTLGVTGLATLTGGASLPNGANIAAGTGSGTKIATATGQKLGFWNVTPVVQQVLATGASHTADEIITFLQLIGLCKQS